MDWDAIAERMRASSAEAAGRRRREVLRLAFGDAPDAELVSWLTSSPSLAAAVVRHAADDVEDEKVWAWAALLRSFHDGRVAAQERPRLISFVDRAFADDLAALVINAEIVSATISVQRGGTHDVELRRLVSVGEDDDDDDDATTTRVVGGALFQVGEAASMAVLGRPSLRAHLEELQLVESSNFLSSKLLDELHPLLRDGAVRAGLPLPSWADVAAQVAKQLKRTQRGVSHRHAGLAPSTRPVVELFSDRNQWLLKFLLFSSELRRPRSLRALATQTQTSLATAQRFVEAWTALGYVVKDDGYRVVRREALMQRWFSNAESVAVTRLPVRLVSGTVDNLLKRLVSDQEAVGHVATGGLAACAQRGVLHTLSPGPVELHVDAAGMQLCADHVERVAAEQAELFLLPAERNATSIFRGLELKHDVDAKWRADGSQPTPPPVDLVQCMLDVWPQPLVGKEQAMFILENVLGWRDP